jgi:hypothetical protein
MILSAAALSLADYVEVKSASFQDGPLQIERRVPDEMKPRQIQINAGDGQGTASGAKTKTIEQPKPHKVCPGPVRPGLSASNS